VIPGLNKDMAMAKLALEIITVAYFGTNVLTMLMAHRPSWLAILMPWFLLPGALDD
jgi:hypothetical protein